MGTKSITVGNAHDLIIKQRDTLRAQRDALLAALDTISGAAWVLPDPELNRVTIDAIKTEADRAIAAVKQEGE